MNILVVGNVLKDVYLNLDARTETFETDKRGVKWLDFGFDGSRHQFFSRHSSFGGAAVTAEVLKKMGAMVQISDTDFEIREDESVMKPTPADSYRYILTSDDGVSYLAESQPKSAEFTAPETPVDYIFVDRSAYISMEVAEKIRDYLDEHMGTGLVLYLKNAKNPGLNSLLEAASLVFFEDDKELRDDYKQYAEELDAVDFDKIVFISENELTYKNLTEPVTVERINVLTHLSAYSIAAAAVLGGFILGKSVEESLKLARANLENATIDAVLDLKEMEIIASASPESLELIAATLVAPGKGILALDESGGSIKRKFEAMGIADTFDNRHDYRNIFLTAPDIEKYLSGVILFDETARDFADGEAVVDYLTARRIIPGIKVDEGLLEFGDSKLYGDVAVSEMPFPEEKLTAGIENLPKKLREYYEMGLRFAKWRAEFRITLSENGKVLTPSKTAIHENCRLLAEYAKDCQSAGLVPIVEPEVVHDGDYPITKCAEVTGKILDELMATLHDFGVNLRAVIIKTNMVLAGKKFEVPSTPSEVGVATAEVLKRHIPSEVAGVVFLSGGQTPEQATDNFRAILEQGPYPWPLTFSFARALQDPALEVWGGNNANAEAARDAFLERLKINADLLKK